MPTSHCPVFFGASCLGANSSSKRSSGNVSGPSVTSVPSNRSYDYLTQGPWETSGKSLLGLGATGATSLTHSPIGALALMRQTFFTEVVVFLGWNMCNPQQGSEWSHCEATTSTIDSLYANSSADARTHASLSQRLLRSRVGENRCVPMLNGLKIDLALLSGASPHERSARINGLGSAFRTKGSRPHPRSLALRPGDSHPPSRKACRWLQMLGSLLLAIQVTGLLISAAAGLSPADQASLRWTHASTISLPP